MTLERTERESEVGTTGDKRPLDIDFDKILSSYDRTSGADDAPPEILVVKSSAGVHCDDRSAKEVERQQGEKQEQEQPQGFNLPEEIVRLDDQVLQDKIHTLSARLKRYSSNLPDKGGKLNALLNQHLDEQGRRKRVCLLEDASRCSKPADLGRSGQSGIPHASKQDPSLLPQSSTQSEFASSFIWNMEHSKNSRICDAFGPELDTLGRGGRNNKRRNGLFAPKRDKKCSLPLNVKDKVKLSPEEIFTHRKNLADTHTHSQLSPICTRRSLRQKALKAEKTVLLLDDEEAESESYVPKEDDVALREMSIFYPSREDPQSIEIQYEDLKCLAPGVYLTSTIMNFYIRYLQVSYSAIKIDLNNCHFFNTYFYKKLQEAMLPQNSDSEALFIKLRRWWKGIDIFQKAYIFLPVHEDLHWSLVIICIPDKEDESGPIILHLDSLGYHNSRMIFQCVKRLLKEEWNYLKGQSDPPSVPMADRIWQHLPRRIDDKIITVPQQNNDSDCGPFVLFFMERFISEAPDRLRKQDLSMFGKQWFKPKEASSLRTKIKKLLMEEFDKAITEVEPAEHSLDGGSSDII